MSAYYYIDTGVSYISVPGDSGGPGPDLSGRESKELLEARQLLELSQEVAHVCSVVWETGTGNVRLSEAAYRLFGYDPAEATLPWKSAHDLFENFVHPDDRDMVCRIMHNSYDEQSFTDCIFRIILQDGETRNLRMVTRRVLNDVSGQSQKVFLIFKDVTRQQHYREALRLDEARLEALVELNSLSCATTGEISRFALDKAIELTGSKTGLISLVSQDETFAEIFSVSMEMMPGWKTDREHMTFSLAGGGLWARAVHSRQPLVINDYARPHDGKKGLPRGHGELKHLLIVPILEDGRVTLLAMVGNKATDYDASDVRQLTLLMSGVWRALSRANADDALREAKTRSELYVDLMSHDIMNLNQIALGYLELTRDQLVSMGGEPDLIDRSDEAMKNITRLIRNVRKIQSAKSATLPLKPIDVNEVISESVRRYAYLPDRDVKMNFVPVEGAIALANELLIDVADNIIGNAVRHSTPGVTLAIDISIGRVTRNGGDYLKIIFDDNGPGITDESKERTFNRLYRGDSGGKGTGLGLYLVKSLVESYRGTVRVEDRVRGDSSKGARFVVTLPAANRPPIT